MLTPMESSIKINLFTDEGALFELEDVRVDKNLQTCLISKALVDRLQARYEASSSNPSAVKSGGQTYNVIGTVKLNWHRRDSPKSHLETFSVVESASALVILGRNALPKSKEPDVHPLGLEQQNESKETSYSLSSFRSSSLICGNI